MRMAKDRVRWGILSTAHIATRRLLPAFARSQTATVVAIASRQREKAEKVASQAGILRAHGSYDALLEDPEVEAIYNPLPNNLHQAWTVRAAAAGKHVLCEKPLAVNAREAQEMVEACRRAGVLLLEAFMYRFHPQIEELQRLTRDGAVGKPWLVRSAFTFMATDPADIRLQASLGGGGLLDVGSYCVNVSRLLLGEPRTAFASAVFERKVDVRLAGILQFDDAAALFDCGVRAPQRQFCEVVGTDGTVLLPRPFQPEEEPALIVVRRGSREERIEIPGTNQYTKMIDYFGACIRQGLSLRFPAEDAVANMRVLDALAQSARMGQTVTL